MNHTSYKDYFSKKYLFLNVFITIVFSLIIFYLIIKGKIYPTIIPMINNGLVYFFADWTAILHANLCYDKGLDVFLENPCDMWDRKHVYGEILLKLPFIKELGKFYYLFIPIIFNILFIYIVVSFFSFEKKQKIFLIFLILSAPTILAVERFNIDILIFLLIYVVAKNTNILVHHSLLILATSFKFYPVITGLIFLFIKNFKSKIRNLFFFILIALLFFLIESNNIIKIFTNQEQFSGLGIYQFSFKGLIEAIFNFNKDVLYIGYIILIISLIPLMIFFLLSLNYFDHKNIDLFENLYENRLFFISSLILISSYFLISNFIYREIFFLGLIPYILKIKNQNMIFFKIYFYFLVFKFLITTILVFINQNQLYLQINLLIVYLKHLFDFYLVSIVTVYLGVIFYKNIKQIIQR